MSDVELFPNAQRAIERHVSAFLGQRLLAIGAINVVAILGFAYQFFVSLPDTAARAGRVAAQETVNQMSVQSEELRSLSQAAYSRTREAQESVGAVKLLLDDLQRQAKALDEKYGVANAAESATIARSINTLMTMNPGANSLVELSTRLEKLDQCLKGLRLAAGPTTSGNKYGAASDAGTQPPPGDLYFMVGQLDGTGTSSTWSYNTYRQLTLSRPGGCD